MKKKIWFISGSPCSGKSTAAEHIKQDYGAYYYKVDDDLEKFISRAAEKGKKSCSACRRMSPDEIWMRDPQIQCDEEFAIYAEIAEYVFAELDSLDAELIVTEGAAYTPEVMAHSGIRDYIALVPSPDFQVSRYRQREWVPYVLKGCRDPEKAFDNWMRRDMLFAAQVPGTV